MATMRLGSVRRRSTSMLSWHSSRLVALSSASTSARSCIGGVRRWEQLVSQGGVHSSKTAALPPAS